MRGSGVRFLSSAPCFKALNETRAFSFVYKHFAESDSPIVKSRQNSSIVGLFIFLNFAEQVVVFEESHQFYENGLLIRVIYSQLNSMDECFARI